MNYLLNYNIKNNLSLIDPKNSSNCMVDGVINDNQNWTCINTPMHNIGKILSLYCGNNFKFSHTHMMCMFLDKTIVFHFNFAQLLIIS